MPSPGRQNSFPPQSPGAGPSSPSRPALPNRVSQLSRKSVGYEPKRSSQMLNVRDDLLMDLLASEAIVDSRGYQVLGAEEVEELKKEQQVLSSRLVAMNKKLSLETKIRDAAQSLSRANAAYKSVNKQTSEQLDAANRKVDVSQKEFWRVSERAAEVQRRLLEHRAGVLSHSVRALERKSAPADVSDNSGYSTPNRSSQLSPVTASSATSIQTVSSKGRFEGAHFVAGHSDTMLLHSPRPPRSTILPKGAFPTDVEEKLKEAEDAQEAAIAKQAELEQELSMTRLEKEQAETTLSLELRTAEDTVQNLQEQLSQLQEAEQQLQAMEEERTVWLNERVELENRRYQVEELKRKIEELQEGHSVAVTASEGALALAAGAHLAEMHKKDLELETIKRSLEEERAAWNLEKATMMGDLNEHVVKLQQDVVSGTGTKAQLDGCVDSLRSLVQDHGLEIAAGAAPAVLVGALAKHLSDVKSQVDNHSHAQQEWLSQRAQYEESARGLSEKSQVLSQQLDDVKRERDEARAEVKNMEVQLQVQTAASLAAVAASNQPPVEYKGDAKSLVAQLQPVWAILPSTEARASKLGSRGFRANSPTSSPVTPRGGVPASLSEMDVRSLKSLYDPKGFALAMNGGGSFTVEAFVERVLALVADDRALIERLIRFAQAHDLLKKNAERAQKLAQDSHVALETYQKQVKTLEERNISLMTQQAELQDEVQWMQETLEQLQAEKLEIETQAAAQAETCAQLTEANNQLSAKALVMANEAASTTDTVRRQLETQLSETRTALAKAKEELESVQQSQQTQQMALLEALNTAQTENDGLRSQLRAKK